MACGHSGTIPAATDRVAAYILKNPPPPPVAAAAPTAAAAAAAANAAEPDDSAAHIDTTNDGDNDDDDWGEDTNEDAVRERMDQLSAATKSLMLTDDLEKTQEERLQIFFEFVEKKAKTADLTLAEHQIAIKSEADRLDISDKAVIVLCEVLFKDNLIERIKLYRNLFLRFTHENHKAQRYLLRGLELTLSSMKELLPKVTTILNMFYEYEIIVEDVFLEWYSKGQKKSKKLELIDRATPFIKWLNEASEESDDEDDKVDIDFDDRIVGNAIKVDTQDEKSPDTSAKTSSGKKGPNAKSVASQEAEDELDIDAI